MKKFAYLNWAEEPDAIQLKHEWIKTLPFFIKDRYILKNCPIKIKEVSLLGAIGFEVEMPITRKETREKSSTYIQKIIDKTVEILKENKVRIILPPEGKNNFSYSIPISKGNCVIPFFIYPAILKGVKESLDKPLKHIQITILDGRNKISDLVLDLIYPHVNYLNIISDEPERFKEKAVEIYGDVGLNLQLLSHNKKTPLETSEIVIDCTDQLHTDFYYCAKNAVYFYIGSHEEMVKNILIKYPGLMVVDDFMLSTQNNKYSTAFCEMIWFVSKRWFDVVSSKEYTLDDLKQINKEIKRDGWTIDKFYQDGNII